MPQAAFVVARNPDPDSSLPYLLRLPLGEGLELKARERWPATARVYCHPVDDWPESAEVLEEVPVVRSRGRAIDLVLCDLLAQLQVRYPAVPIVFCDSRKLAEDWTYRFLAAALVQQRAAEAVGSSRP